MEHTKLNIPKGKFSSEKTEERARIISVKIGEDSRRIALMNFGFLGDVKACSSLFCESANVYNETGYTPRQLADQKKVMLEVLEEVTAFLGHVQPRIGEEAFNYIRREVEKAIKQATE